jgi:hypothetical protein
MTLERDEEGFFIKTIQGESTILRKSILDMQNELADAQLRLQACTEEVSRLQADLDEALLLEQNG